MISIGLGLGIGAAPVAAAPANFRTIVTWNSWWAETIASSGGNVTQWTDGSGNGRHWLPVSGHAPTVGGAGFNSKPWLAFASASTQSMNQTAILSDIISAGAGYMVAAINATSVDTGTNPDAGQTILGAVGGYTAMALDSRQTDGSTGGPPYSYEGYVYDGGYKIARSSFAAGAVKIVETWWDGANVHSRVNGGTTATTAAGAIQVVTGALLLGKAGGALTYYNGGIAALAAIASVPSSGNRDAITAAMMAEFGAT